MALTVTLTFPKSGVTGLLVHHYDYVDALNDVFTLTLDVASTDPDIDMATLVGEDIVVKFGNEFFLQEIKGIVRCVRQLSAEPTGISQYVLIVVPPLWLMSRGAQHRIFQDVTAVDICQQVAGGYGARIPAPKDDVAPGKPKQEYRVQYGETDLDFAFRVLAEEGIALFFDHAAGSTWKLTDNIHNEARPSRPVQFIQSTGAGMIVAAPQVSKIAISTALETSKVTVRDWDFKNPKPPLQKDAKAAEKPFIFEADLEHYEYLSGKFGTATEGTGQILATQFLEEARSERRLFECHSNFALTAGETFQLGKHPRKDVNGLLRVIRSRCSVSEGEGGKIERHHVLVCVAARAPWHAERRPKPRIYGTHLAVVAHSDGGEEIEVDEHGRVRLLFRWDRRDADKAPTRWVRVSQGWAGADRGMVMLPRCGDEVMVAYLDGDPDEPIVVGRVHNAVNVNPLNLPADKTKSIWKSKTTPGGEGYNEVMMEDKKGSELLRFHAQKDWQSDTIHDSLTTVGHNETLKVQGNSAYTIKGAWSVGSGSTSISTGPYTLSAKSIDEKSRSTVSVSAPESITLQVAKKDSPATTITIYPDKIAIDSPNGAIDISSKGDLSLKSEANINLTATGNVVVKGALIKLNC